MKFSRLSPRKNAKLHNLIVLLVLVLGVGIGFIIFYNFKTALDGVNSPNTTILRTNMSVQSSNSFWVLVQKNSPSSGKQFWWT